MSTTYDPEQWIACDEPLGPTDVSPIYSGVLLAQAKDIVAQRRRDVPRYTADGFSDQDVLEDWMAVHWAWPVDPPNLATARR